MNKIIKYAILEFKLLFRVPIGLFFTIAFPQILLMTFVSVSNNSKIPNTDLNFVDVYLPTMFLLTLMSAGIISFSIIVSGNRSSKLWQYYKLKGLRSYQIIISNLIVNIFLTLIASILLIVSANFIFSAKIPKLEQLLVFIFVWLLGAYVIFMIGFVIGSFSKNEKVAQAISTPILFVMMILSGVMVNIKTLPDNIQKISEILPTTQVNKLYIYFWNKGEGSKFPENLWILFIWGITLTIIVIIKMRKENFSRK